MTISLSRAALFFNNFHLPHFDDVAFQRQVANQ